MAEPLHIDAADGRPLAATRFAPAALDADHEAPLVVVAPATGVAQGYYAPYARFLAESGMWVVTFDYRGIGGSRHDGPLRGEDARMADWGRHDLHGVLGWAGRHHPQRPLMLVGHSIGGQLPALSPHAERLRAILGIGAQCIYHRLWPWPDRWVLAVLWHLFVPGVTRLLGYFPSRLLRMGENLPAGVAREWARWSRTRHLLLDHDEQPLPQYFSEMSGAVLAFSFADDRYAPENTVATWLTFWSQARHRRHRHLSPADLATRRRIGHFGFFRSAFQPTLWEESRSWLWAQLRRPSA